MRVMLKASRYLRRSGTAFIIWIFGVFIFAAVFTNDLFVKKYTEQDRVLRENHTGQIFNFGVWPLKTRYSDVDGSDAKAKVNEDSIRQRIVVSSAGNFFYVSRGNATVFDSSRGQFRIIDKYLDRKEQGVFVEIGTEGDNAGSLTFLLEMSRGWSGLVVEPYTRKFESLMYMKRNSNFLQSCINTTNGEWPADEPRSKPCLNIPDILKAAKIDKIDLLALDVVGREMQLLKSFPFKHVNVSMISIELYGLNMNVNDIVNELKDQFESVQMMANHVVWRTDMIFLNRDLIT